MPTLPENALAAVVVFAAVASWSVFGVGLLERHRPLGLLAFACVCTFGIILGRHHLLWIDHPINPDEALMAANALRMRFGLLDWNIVDPLTSGPLNSLVLGWPYFFGGDVTLFSARLTGIVCCSAAMASLFAAIRHIASTHVALVSTLPATLFLVGTSSGEFVHYSSEQLPIFMLSAAIALLIGSTHQANPYARLLGAALLLGAVPYAKLQAAPMAACLGAFVLYRVSALSGDFTARLRRVCAAVAVALVPTGVFAVPLIGSGGISDFVTSYIVMQSVRIGGWHNPIGDFAALSTLYARLFETAAVLVAGAIATTLAIYLKRREPGPLGRSPWIIWLGLALSASTIFTIVLPGRAFPHYLLLSLPGLTLLIGLAAAALSRVNLSRPISSIGKLGSLAMIIGLIGPAAAAENWNQGGLLEEQGRAFAVPHSLAWLGIQSDETLLCWGWRPECYVDAALPSATREATNEYQTYDTPLRPYFRKRFLADLEKSRPDFIFDTAAPGSFNFNDPNQHGISSFPELDKVVNSRFELFSTVVPEGRCPRLYVRRTRLSGLQSRLISFASITASASKALYPVTAIDDRSTFESCDDYWLLPDRTLGTLEVTFDRASSVRLISILNTRNGSSMDRAAKLLRITLLDGGQPVFAVERRPEWFPWWTIVDVPNVAADTMRIEVLAFEGDGGGLNEVKVFRGTE